MTSRIDYPPLSAELAGIELWANVVGQDDAIGELRAAVNAPVHAYMLVGPRGSGKRELARAFAAALVSRDRTGDDAVRQARMALMQNHSDITEFERVGASISAEQADAIIATAARSSIEDGPKVLILDEFHLVTTAAPKLLKTIEEPPAGTVFVVLADDVPNDLVTIASRCVRIDLATITDDVVTERLVAEGVAPDRAADAAAAAVGDLGRARLLATDDRLSLRRAAWCAVPDRLDGTGARAIETVDDLLAMIEDAMAPLADSHAAEVAEFAELVAARGERGSGRKQFEDRHKREVRRYRTDEIRAGLTELSRRYRDDLATSPRPAEIAAAIDDIAALATNLVRNPNERLQLVALFTKLGRPHH